MTNQLRESGMGTCVRHPLGQYGFHPQHPDCDGWHAYESGVADRPGAHDEREMFEKWACDYFECEPNSHFFQRFGEGDYYVLGETVGCAWESWKARAYMTKTPTKATKSRCPHCGCHIDNPEDAQRCSWHPDAMAGRASVVQPSPVSEPRSLWGWPIEEIKSAMRQFQSKHPDKLPLDIERAAQPADAGKERK